MGNGFEDRRFKLPANAADEDELLIDLVRSCYRDPDERINMPEELLRAILTAFCRIRVEAEGV